MIRKKPSVILFAGMLGIATMGCSDAGSDLQRAGANGGAPASGGGAGISGTGGSIASGGTGGSGSGGQSASGGSAGLGASGASSGSGGSSAAGGAAGTSGENAGSSGDTGGMGASAGTGGSMGGAAAGTAGGGGIGAVAGSSGSTAAGAGGGANPGTCTESKATSSNATGSGPHDVTVETNSDEGINEGTIFRPTDLGGAEKYPIFVWGEGGCSQDGMSNAQAMTEIASYGYFVVADGTPGGSGNRTMDRSDLAAMGGPLIAYVDWAIAENEKPCSAYYQSLETTKIASNGFSCGGLMAQGTVTDPRFVTWGVTSSGMAGATQPFYDLIDTPVLFVEGGPSEVAYDGGVEGYEAISELGVPVLWFSKDIGHGGDLFQPGGGDFTKINLAWLNWWLKGDETVTGKGLLVGAGCPYCSDSAWEVRSANVP